MASKRIRITTGIGRVIDLRYTSNRYALVVAGLAAFATLFWRLTTTGDDAWFWAFRVSAGVFLAWALGRELDPDEPASAAVAPLTVLPLLLLGPPSIAGSVAVLLAARIIVRSTGLSPSWFDAFLLIGGSAYLGAQPEAWPAAGALILAVLGDRILYPSGPTRSLYTGGLMTLAASATAIMWADKLAWESPKVGEWIAVALVLISVVAAVLMVRPPTTRGDFRKEQLADTRVMAVRLGVGATLLAGLAYSGGSIIPGLSPLWAGIVAIPTASWVRKRVLRPM